MDRRHLVFGSVVCGALLLGACAGGQKGPEMAEAPKIEDSWLARVPAQDLGNVEQARTERRMAQDEVDRAQVDVTDAENQLKVSESKIAAAESQVEAADAQVEAAKQTGDRMRIEEAEQNLEDRKLAAQAAEQRVEMEKARVDAAKTRHQLAEARLGTRDVMVSRAEYETLRAQGDTRVADIDPTRFDQAIADRRAREAQLEGQLAEKERSVIAAQSKYDDLQYQLQARQPQTSPAG